MRVIEVPYAYRADIVFTRHRVSRMVWVVDTVPVRIREIELSDAPVFATWSRTYTNHIYGDAGPLDVSADHMIEYRSMEGLPLRPWVTGMGIPGGSRPQADPVGAALLQRDLDDWVAVACAAPGPAWMAHRRTPWTLAQGTALSAGVPSGAIRRQDVSARAWGWNDGETTRAAVVRALEERSAFIGGIFHVGSSGPAWKAEIDGISAEPEYSIAGDEDMLFRADRREGALAHCAVLRELTRPSPGARTPTGTPAVTGRIHISDHAPLAAVDDRGPGISATVRKLSGIAQDKVGGMPPDAIIRYAELMRTLGREGLADPDATLKLALAFERDWVAHLPTINYAPPVLLVAQAFATRKFEASGPEPAVGPRP